jgi:uracil-DNA glycosylase
MENELEILRPKLLIPVGKLAISQFMEIERLDAVIGRTFPLRRNRRTIEMIPLPHPSGASPWHRIPPGKALLEQAMQLIARHAAMQPLLPGNPVATEP